MPTFVTPPSMATKTTMGTRGAHVARALDVRRTARGIAHRRVTRNIVGGPGTSPQQHHSHRPPRSRTAVCTRGAHHPRVHAASISMPADDASGDSSGPPTRIPGRIATSTRPRRTDPPPAKSSSCSSVNPCASKNCPRGHESSTPEYVKTRRAHRRRCAPWWRRALDDPVGQPPLRDKIRDLVKAKGSKGCK